MIIKRYEEIMHKDYGRFDWFGSVSQAMSIITNKYLITSSDRKSADAYCSLTNQWPRILWVADGDLKGKRILDLGCGNNSHNDDLLGDMTNRMFEPWLCRALNESGANPVGVDIGNLDMEEFEHHQVNLLKKECLHFLKDNSIDIANAHLLFDSYFLHKFQEHSRSGIDLKGILMPQLERVVRKNGYFLYNFH
jgi:hypothetical protein